MAILNSNPEILLRKRKDKDRKRLEKQEQAKQREVERLRKKKSESKKFIRAETLVSNHLSKELESKRVKNITKHENNKLNEGISSKKEQEEKLIFVIRIPNHIKGVKIPSKANKVLRVLRLEHINNGVFMKLNESTAPLLKLIHPYVVYGSPSIQSIRQLFQKRGSIKDEEGNVVKLDNNQLVEDKFEEQGLICIEDLIQELCNLSENFTSITSWLVPFKLNLPVSGFGPQSKLAKLKLAELNKKSVSLSGSIKLEEADIDQLIEDQN